MPSIARFDREFFERLADWLAVAVAVTLPWSTSAVGIFVVAWVLAVLPTLPWPATKRELRTAAGGLPLLLWILAALGMVWADVAWPARFAGLGGFNKLLMVPLLLAQFRRSRHGAWVLYGFLISAASVMAASYAMVLAPKLLWRTEIAGIPVHDDIFQNTEFSICAFALLGLACERIRKRDWRAALAWLGLAALFLGNILFVFTSRVTLVIIPILALLLGWRQLRWAGVFGACLLAVAIGAASWFTSPMLRARMIASVNEVQAYRTSNAATSIGMHTAFLKELLAIIAAAPIVGHGTGSISAQFQRITANGNGASSIATVNPHNQTFAVAIQLGVLGAIVLWAMWIAHLLLFRGAATCGVDWFDRGDGEYRLVHGAHAPVRFCQWLALRVRRRRARRHGVAGRVEPKRRGPRAEYALKAQAGLSKTTEGNGQKVADRRHPSHFAGALRVYCIGGPRSRSDVRALILLITSDATVVADVLRIAASRSASIYALLICSNDRSNLAMPSARRVAAKRRGDMTPASAASAVLSSVIVVPRLKEKNRVPSGASRRSAS